MVARRDGWGRLEPGQPGSNRFGFMGVRCRRGHLTPGATAATCRCRAIFSATLCGENMNSANCRARASRVPHPRDVHLSRESLARGDAAPDGCHLQEYADTWTRRGVRAWHEGWWRWAGRLETCSRPIGRAARHDLDAPERHGCHGDHRLLLHVRRASPQNRDDRPRVPVEHVLVRRVSTVRRRGGVRPVARYRADDLERLLDAIDERTLLVPLSIRPLPQRLHSERACRHREGAPGGCARDPRRVSGRRRGPSRH